MPVDSQYSLPVKTLNLIVKSKSIRSFFMEIIFFQVLGKNVSIRSKLPTDLNIELHLPVEAKEKPAILLFCGFSFPCFNVIISIYITMMQFDMTFDDTLRDGSS